jgi:hypothetical protein
MIPTKFQFIWLRGFRGKNLKCKKLTGVYFNIGGGSKLPGSSIDTTVNRLARYNIGSMEKFF